MHFPHPDSKNIKRCHRLVVLPDYQGIGLGIKLLEIVARHYKSIGMRFTIVTSARNVIFKLNSSKDWIMHRLGIMKLSKTGYQKDTKATRSKCKTASFEYWPKEDAK